MHPPLLSFTFSFLLTFPPPPLLLLLLLLWSSARPSRAAELSGSQHQSSECGQRRYGHQRNDSYCYTRSSAFAGPILDSPDLAICESLGLVVTRC
ncbi:hypothetical protein E2C01_100434 [Portunus trituberculatus]|uniref:Secreted protein n=1 Tax=Portunus trituberculatus TaxID=210409 RepID=A0A5B7KHY8_PORTR|nr:hypothetical protein [Portunus trituberculatus]